LTVTLRSDLPFSELRDLFNSTYQHQETSMRNSLFAIVTASAFLAGAGLASAQTTTTTTQWTPDQGSTITQYSSTQHYKSFSDPTMKPTVGMALPSGVTVYPLPDTMKVERPERYSYGIVNNDPVVVDRSSRKVIHTWN
jgi:hypothetical protein